jgi:hypothetical protein
LRLKVRWRNPRLWTSLSFAFAAILLEKRNFKKCNLGFGLAYLRRLLFVLLPAGWLPILALLARRSQYDEGWNGPGLHGKLLTLVGQVATVRRLEMTASEAVWSLVLGHEISSALKNVACSESSPPALSNRSADVIPACRYPQARKPGP